MLLIKKYHSPSPKSRTPSVTLPASSAVEAGDNEWITIHKEALKIKKFP